MTDQLAELRSSQVSFSPLLIFLASSCPLADGPAMIRARYEVTCLLESLVIGAASFQSFGLSESTLRPSRVAVSSTSTSSSYST